MENDKQGKTTTTKEEEETKKLGNKNVVGCKRDCDDKREEKHE